MGWARLACAAAAASIFACGTAELKQPASQEVPGEEPGVLEDGGVADPSDAAGPGEKDAADLAATGPVSIQVLPSDSGAALLAAIKAAKKSVHVTMYLFTNDALIDALADLKTAGKDVKVVLNQKFPPNGGSNQVAYNQFVIRGVPVVWAPAGFTYTHAKVVIIDGAKLILMTMNMTETSAFTNREYIATDTDPQDVADAETLFQADFMNQQTAQLQSKLVVSPKSANSVNAQTRLRTLIDSAKTSLDVEVQSLSDDVMVDAIIAAKQRGVAVRVVLDGDLIHTSGQQQAVDKLKAAAVPLRGLSNPDVHAKVIVVDESRTFVGSQNLTPTALNNNRELGLVTDSKSEATKVRNTIAGDFAKGTAP